MRAILQHVSPRVLTVVIVAVVAFGLFAAPPSMVSAQRAPVLPTGGLWCGTVSTGGSIFLQVSADGRFVDWVDIHTPKGMVSTREREVRGVTRAQVATSKFIFRQRRDEKVCRRGDPRDPRDPRERCTVVTLEDVTVRGTFKAPTVLRGSFSAQQVIDPSAIEHGRGRLRKRLITGSYDAWPAGTQPCP